jgi:C4-dicarboxylate-specific signal transduction histidine kinase
MIGKAELSENLKSIEQLRETLRGILGSAHRAAEILKRFDSLHKGGDHRLAKRWMFAHEPLEEAVAMLSHQIKTNNVRVCWIRKKSCLIYGNATALVQVYVNLLINAMHAMGSSGQIDLSVVEIAGKIEVKFRDYGPGVDKKIVDKICEPFFTTKGENGTGLGLSISKEIIETDHDGKFTVANHEIKGLEVTIHFPVKEEDAKPESNG